MQKYFKKDINNNKYGINDKDLIANIKNTIEKNIENEDIYSLRHQVLYEHNIFYSIANMIDEEMFN